MSTRDPEAWMWAEACQMLERAERLQRQFFRPAPARQASWEPPVDLFETEGELWIVVALPGVDPDHLRVVIDGDTLVVEGARALPDALRGAVIHRLEVPYGRFERRIRLPAMRLALDMRELRDGCLMLGLRKLG